MDTTSGARWRGKGRGRIPRAGGAKCAGAGNHCFVPLLDGMGQSGARAAGLARGVRHYSGGFQFAGNRSPVPALRPAKRWARLIRPVAEFCDGRCPIAAFSARWVIVGKWAKDSGRLPERRGRAGYGPSPTTIIGELLESSCQPALSRDSPVVVLPAPMPPTSSTACLAKAAAKACSKNLPRRRRCGDRLMAIKSSKIAYVCPAAGTTWPARVQPSAKFRCSWP